MARLTPVSVARNVQSMPEYITDVPRWLQEKRGCIGVRPSGLYVNPLHMRARDIRIEDIAHHLSLICRYTGACPYHYSVGQHSILVSEYLRAEGASAELQLAGLLHDSAEYVLNDLASPVKHDPRMKWYRDLDHELTRLVLYVFGVNPDLLLVTKPADDAVFHREVTTWWGVRKYRPISDVVHPRLAASIEYEFLDLFHQLQKRIAA